jgi:hypothetical protein
MTVARTTRVSNAPGRGGIRLLDAPAAPRLESAAAMSVSETRLGPYEIPGPLGAGGMGEVYRAFDSRLKPTGGAQDPVADAARRPRPPRPLPTRGRGARLAQPSAHRRHLRPRGQQRRPGAGDGTGRGSDARRSYPPRPCHDRAEGVAADPCEDSAWATVQAVQPRFIFGMGQCHFVWWPSANPHAATRMSLWSPADQCSVRHC